MAMSSGAFDSDCSLWAYGGVLFVSHSPVPRYILA
jgi:hypothetical protein